MIRRSGLKPHAFLSAIATTIGANSRAEITEIDFAPMAEEFREEIYLAGGYWRALATWSEDGRLESVRLVNPDRTPTECRIVEQGIAILRHLEYAE